MLKLDTSWYSQDKSTYHINSVEQLLGLAAISNSDGGVIPFDNFAGKTIFLGRDIDLSVIGNDWCPIGVDKAFSGTFDGMGFKLYGLKVNRDVSYIAVFGSTSEDAIIKNLTVSANLRCTSQIGGIVAVNGGLISACKFDGIIEGGTVIGGITATNDGIIERCCNKGRISGETQYVGGIIGVNHNVIGKVVDCYNTGYISGKINVGGIAGYNTGTLIENCFNIGQVGGITAIDIVVHDVGGITGFSNAGCLVKNCYNSAVVSGSSNIGGIVGHNYGFIDNCLNQSNVNGSDNVGGIIGCNDSGSISNSKNLGAIKAIRYTGGIAGCTHSGVIESCNNCAEVTGSQEYIGGIVGHSKWGSIVNNFNMSAIKSNGISVGGIVGEIKYGFLRGCTNMGEVTGVSQVGGVAGSCLSRASAVSCSNLASVTGNKCVGGLIGRAFGDIKDSYNTGSVNADEEFSNLVAVSEGGVLQECFSTGKMVNRRGR